MCGALPRNLTYFQPTINPQPTQKMSATVCNPLVIILSSFSPTETFTLSKNKRFQLYPQTEPTAKYVATVGVQEARSNELQT